jgi:hypothetical protein
VPHSAAPFRIAVIGAGPGGLSTAHFIQQAGHEATVFEADSRLGGKSFSVVRGDAMNEMGTCYTTRSHKLVKRWMKERGITLTRLGEARYDGVKVVDYVKQGDGPPLAWQALKFIRAAGRLRRDIRERPDDPAVCEEAAMTTAEWVKRLNLPKIDLASHRIQTTQGYGFTDEATIGQTVQWCDLNYLLSGVLNDMHMPDQGWSEFWSRFAQDKDVRLDSPVTHLDRSGPKPVVTAAGKSEAFDAVVSTVPMQNFVQFCAATRDEMFIRNGIEWQNYTTTLLTSPDWFDGHMIIGYSEASMDSSRKGAILGGRREGESEELGGRLYVTGQFSTGLTPAELREILMADAEKHGFTIESVIQQKVWQYFPQYTADAVRNGLFGALRRVQGHKRTWFSGSSFSHELVCSIVEQSQGMVGHMLHELSRQPAQATSTHPVRTAETA